MKFVGDDLFFENNPRIIESKIIEFILSLKNKGKSHGAILNYLNAIKSFYKINDIVLNAIKLLARLFPPIRNLALRHLILHQW
jgi:hypothetical protein